MDKISDQLHYKIMRKLLPYLAIAMVFIGCTNSSSVEKKIEQKIENCNTDTCSIRLKQIADFQWDKMYVFNHPSAPDVIDNALGIHYPYYVEFTRSIIFLKGKQIVHYENNHSKAEGPTDGEVLFDYPDTLNYMVYRPTQLIYKIKRDTSNGIRFYIVTIK